MRPERLEGTLPLEKEFIVFRANGHVEEDEWTHPF